MHRANGWRNQLVLPRRAGKFHREDGVEGSEGLSQPAEEICGCCDREA